MSTRLRLLVTIIVTVALLCAAPNAAPQAQTPTARWEPPRLVVILVADQFRADYPDLYGHHWTRGLKRIFETGAVFPLAEYPYALTVTCAGHATIGTGTLPATHGMVANDWYDRALGKQVGCANSPTTTSVPLGGGPGVERQGPYYLRVNTLADELRAQRAYQPTVVSLAQKPRSVITLAGRPSPSTYAIWTEDNGSWATSSAYATVPPAIADQWATANPPSRDYGRLWEPILTPEQFLFSDDAPGEPAPRVFPHRIASASGKPDAEFASSWERSPFGDAALGQFAAHLVKELKMGTTPGGTDLLTIGFSALDSVGHRFGPHSHEVQDLLANLDRTIGTLLDTLDATVGRDRYVLAFSSDHGVAPMVERSQTYTPSAGRYTTAAIRAAIEDALKPHLGEGPHLQTTVGFNVYFRPESLARIKAHPAARAAVIEALEAMPAIDRAYWAEDLSQRTATDDRILAMTRRSYAEGNSGDLMFVVAPNWVAQSTSLTTHGSPWGYDTRVPVVFMGAGTVPGRHPAAASPADIAPTLAFLLRLTMTTADGRVLTDAVR